jgi:signal transduction histidine kinase
MITPPFWQTLWFRVLAIFAVGGAIAAVYHLRVRMLRKQKRLLEIQVQERTLELQQKNAQLQELNASKDKFFSIIAHDLRSPFNALLGYTHLMSEQLYMYRRDELKQHVGKLRTAAEKLYALLENLLTWARIQRGGMEYAPEEFDLQELAEYATDLFTSKAEQKQIRLTNLIQDQTLVMADFNMINTVMRNLVSNALKFTPGGGQITLTARKNEHWVEIAVSDTGIGMNQEAIAKLFRLDVKYTTNGTDGEPGTGLGLLLCHDLVERHGGRMWVESESAQGTTFRFTLQSPQDAKY